MKFESLVELTGAMSCFDMALLVQAFDEKRVCIQVQLSRWMAQGRVIGLRRGLYTLSDTFRRVELEPAVLANEIYRPSYLSGLWALGHYDLIPERVIVFTSVTSRLPQQFENICGTFNYRHIKQECFWGYLPVKLGASQFLVAEPEKALLDHWHLTPGEWTPERLEEMRYQNTALVNAEQLEKYARLFKSPRLLRAAQLWLQVCTHEEHLLL